MTQQDDPNDVRDESMSQTTRRGLLGALGVAGLASLGSGSASAQLGGGPEADAMSEHRVPMYRVPESDLDSPGVVGREVTITSGGATYETGDQLVDLGDRWELVSPNYGSLSADKTLNDHSLPPLSEIGNDPKRVTDALEMFADGSAWTDPVAIDLPDRQPANNNPFSSAVYAPTGEILLIPMKAEAWGVIDPDTGIFTYGDDAGDDVTTWMGGSVLKDGRVVIAPHDGGVIGLYDPRTHTHTTGPDTGKSGGAFVGSILSPNGVAVLVPRNSPHVGLFDPSTDTYSDGDTHGVSSDETPDFDVNAFQGGTLIADGTMVFAPSGHSNIGLYDPSTDTYTDGPTHGETGTRKFVGCVLLPDNRVLLVPYDSPNVGFYDPDNNEYISGPSHGLGEQAFVGGQLLPTGEVLLIPEKADRFGIVNVTTDTYRNGPVVDYDGKAYRGSALDHNGNVWVAHAGTKLQYIQTNTAISTQPQHSALHPLIQSL